MLWRIIGLPTAILLYSAAHVAFVTRQAGAVEVLYRVYSGTEEWLRPVNDIAQDWGFRQLTWSNSTARYLSSSLRNETSMGPCEAAGRILPYASVYGTYRRWVSTASSFLLQLQWEAFYNDPSSPSEYTKRAKYIFRGPRPVSIACVVHACSIDSSMVMCLTDIALSTARDFNIRNQADSSRTGTACKRYPYRMNSTDTILSIGADPTVPVNASTVACWYRYIDNVLKPPLIIGMPCPDDAVASCDAWDAYQAVQSGIGTFEYYIRPEQSLSEFLVALGLDGTPTAQCILCHINNYTAQSCFPGPNTLLEVDVAAILGRDSSRLEGSNCPGLARRSPTTRIAVPATAPEAQPCPENQNQTQTQQVECRSETSNSSPALPQRSPPALPSPRIRMSPSPTPLPSPSPAVRPSPPYPPSPSPSPSRSPSPAWSPSPAPSWSPAPPSPSTSSSFAGTDVASGSGSASDSSSGGLSIADIVGIAIGGLSLLLAIVAAAVSCLRKFGAVCRPRPELFEGVSEPSIAA